MKFWQQLSSKLQEHQNIYLLTVIQNSGSSPGRKGFKMFVAEDDFIYGSIGGGIMEYTLVEEAKELLQHDSLPILYKKQQHQGTGKDKSGMICSGEQTVVFHPFKVRDIALIEDILVSLQNNLQKTICYAPSGVQLTTNNISEKYTVEINSETRWEFKELIAFKETIYIIGGGHVGLAVSKIFRSLDFHTVVFDNRKNLNTLAANSFAHQKHVIDYENIANHIQQGANSYVAIMTNTYKDDKLILSKIIRNKHKYIGVLGSKAKLKTMWQVLQNEGVSLSELNKINAPIGLQIKSQTPEEIAISIAAKVIELKNRNL